MSIQALLYELARSPATMPVEPLGTDGTIQFSVAVCGVVPIAARNIAGIVVWSIHAGSMEGPLMYLQPMPWVRGMYYRCGVLETHDDYATR